MTEASASLHDKKPASRTSSIGSLHERMEETAISPSVTLVAKFGKERIHLSGLRPDTTIGQVKDELQIRTRILPKRQKLVGLIAQKGGPKGVHDDLTLSELKLKAAKSSSSATNAVITHQFILMGTPEEEIFVDPGERDDLPDVVDDFDLDFNAGSTEWLQHVAKEENLKKFTEKTEIHIMNPPRAGKPLLVLDLDHTLLDFSSRRLQQDDSTHVVGQGMAAQMKRPHMDEFLTTCYQYYDLAVWSQTSWRWLETKLTELGMLTHPGYRFCFVLDKTSMFTITSTKRDGTSIQHHVKPLQIIWSKFEGRWGSHNTVHLDDLSRNFALNLGSGLKCTAYYRKKNKRDNELLGLGRYLEQLGRANVSYEKIDFSKWMDVIQGNCQLIEPKMEDYEEEKEG